jgi:tetratricopeptide (TPR) repeat protein
MIFHRGVFIPAVYSRRFLLSASSIMAEHLQVMISSTARDLPEHRREAMDACLRQGMFPIMMEHLPASDDEAVPASLKMVNEADIYVLILAHRYGYVPDANNPTRISVTEHEYNRAVERKIPILTFAMHEDHPVKAADVEKGEGAVKLEAFKKRALVKGANFFKSPADLRANVIDSLSDHRYRDVTSFHYVTEIPKLPTEFIAHPYTLLQTKNLIGRQKELKLLTDWITGKELDFDGEKTAADSVRIMSVVAIGGMGKSALTWKWFNDVAPQEMKNLAGRMWWSFYESDASFENFVIRALAYVSSRSIEQVTQIPPPNRETELLGALDQRAFLLVLDGLERILIAYARMDAARLDEEVGKEKNLRKTADPRVGSFLKKLAQVKQSRILVSSRLYPAELETVEGSPIKGTFRINIGGLTDEDAVELWRASGVSGSRDELLSVFNTFGKHPLVIQALAGEVKRYRKAPGNFGEWRTANRNFDPGGGAGTKEAMGHVLEFALRDLGKIAKKVLHAIAAFRMPTSYDTLAAVLVGENKACANEPELDAALNELEDRALVGWDKRANRYDLHPLVRGVVWSGLNDDVRRGVYTNMQEHFEAVPKIDDYNKVNTFEDLTPAVELYHTLIGLRRYDDAFKLFAELLDKATHFRLSANRQRTELLELLFPLGAEQLPHLDRQDARAYTLNSLAQGYMFCGEPGRAADLYRRGIAIRSEMNSEANVGVVLRNLSNTLRLSGALYESESVARRALLITRRLETRFEEAVSLYWLGLTLAGRGLVDESGSALMRALQIRIAQSSDPGIGVINSYLAQRAVWLGDFRRAQSFSKSAWELAYVRNNERDFIRAARTQGEAALGLSDLVTADEHLHHALTRARNVNHVEEELHALVALAELRRRKRDMKEARELLDDLWEPAERGPYPLIQADAFNVLAQIERDEGKTTAAMDAATKAYQFAWCDGPPFAYHWGLEKAKKHLKELGAPEPEMPPFDESKFEPMPEVEINPKDEFYVDEESVN